MATTKPATLPPSAYPGLVLGAASRYVAGAGTHVYQGNVVASLVGRVQEAKPGQLSVVRHAASSRAAVSRSGAGTATLPTVGSIVLARVTRLRARDVNVSIAVVDGQACAEPLQGVVRREDVRGWEVDRVVLGEAFRVGDIVRAAVRKNIDMPSQISLGDQAAYYLSTARNELGVLLATSELGNQMYPVSWKEFRDPETGRTEARKVAKPI